MRGLGRVWVALAPSRGGAGTMVDLHDPKRVPLRHSAAAHSSRNQLSMGTRCCKLRYNIIYFQTPHRILQDRTCKEISAS